MYYIYIDILCVHVHVICHMSQLPFLEKGFYFTLKTSLCVKEMFIVLQEKYKKINIK